MFKCLRLCSAFIEFTLDRSKIWMHFPNVCKYLHFVLHCTYIVSTFQKCKSKCVGYGCMNQDSNK